MHESLSSAAFARALAEEAANGAKVLLLAPLGAGKSHALRACAETLRGRNDPIVYLDVFTAASTPEQLLTIMGQALLPYVDGDKEHTAVLKLMEEGGRDRRAASSAFLSFLGMVATRRPAWPVVFLVDEITEIRSLAYFPELGQVETPFAAALLAARGVIATSSYLGLATELFKELEVRDFAGLTNADLAQVPSLRSDGDAVQAAVGFSGGAAATLLPLVNDMRESRDLQRSLVRLLSPGGGLEMICRAHYEVLLVRSRGYAVSKRAAEAVAEAPGARLTDLFPKIGRTAGASRQYLRWLVEVGLLVQVRKRYDFADRILGLWASLYLGRGSQPSESEIKAAVTARLASLESMGPPEGPETAEPPVVAPVPKKRVDRFEEID